MDGMENFSKPATPDAVKESYAKNLSWLALDKEKLNKQAKWRGTLAFALIGCVCVQSVAVAVMATRQTTKVLIATVRHDGTVDLSPNMPVSLKARVITQTLWTYVYRHEHFNRPDAHLDWDFVSALSSPEVAKQYQTAVDPKMPTSPMRVFGSRKQEIVVKPLGGFFYSNTEDYDAGTYIQRYQRRVVGETGQTETCQRMSVTIGYKTAKAMQPEVVANFDPAQIVVTAYPSPVPETEPVPGECAT